MQIETKNIDLSTHAYERIQERYPSVAKNKTEARNYIRSILKHSDYIGIVPDNDGNDSHMYVYNNDIVMHISPEIDLVKTVYKAGKGNRAELKFRDSVVGIYKKEFRKIHRTELSLRRKLEYTTVQNEAKVAALKFRRFKTRSENVKKECDDEIAKLQNEVLIYNNKIKEIQKTKRHIAYALASDIL